MIKNIVFDIGDVLIEYRWRDMLAEYGLEENRINEVGIKMFENPLWKKLDLGEVSLKEAIAEYQRLYPEEAETISWFLNHAERMSVQRPRVWERMKTLKELGYHLYLLSNYSKDLLETHTKNVNFYQHIEGGVISYQIGKLKPEAAIYECLLQKYHLQAEECLFFDDRAENVEGAIKVGMQSIQVLSQEQLIKELDLIIQKVQ